MKLLHKVLYGHLRCLEIWEHFINELLFALRHRISSLSTLLNCHCHYIIIHTYTFVYEVEVPFPTPTSSNHNKFWETDVREIILQLKFSLNFLSNVCTLTALRNLFKLSTIILLTREEISLQKQLRVSSSCVCLLCVHKVTLSLNIKVNQQSIRS